MRLDMYLVNHNIANTRSLAQSIIKNNRIKIDGKVINKPSFEIKEGFDINRINVDKDNIFVSRAGNKLDLFMPFFKSFGGNVEGKIALDIGSSTGGFAQILLLHNVKNLTCVDVGKDQFNQILQNDKRVCLKENTDIREFAKIEENRAKYNLITCDVSFISLSHILDSIYYLASENADIILLFKPQFEVGIDAKRNKKGVLKDDGIVENRFKEFVQEMLNKKFEIVTFQYSKLLGKEGNSEIFIYARKS